MPKLQSPIHITDLQDFYSALRDGNYWLVFQKGINILNTLINPHTDTVGTPRGIGRATRNVRQYPLTGHDETQFSDVLDKIEQEKTRLEGQEGQKVKAMGRMPLGADVAPQIDIAGILAIVELVISIFQRFRGRGSLPTGAARPNNASPESGLKLESSQTPDDDDSGEANRVVQPGVKPNQQVAGKDAAQPGKVVSGGTNPPVTKVENPKNKG